MCGISGFIDPSSGLEQLLELQNALKHRGPDASGHFFKPGVGLAHNRLSIIDLSHAADQPLFFEDLVIVYNGETYNYKEIQKELEAKGYTFTTTSDTEVILKGFHCWGPDILNKIIGMFAFALYNQRTGELFLCRDRIGVKPLYYLHEGESIFFASELKAFRKLKKSFSIDQQALEEYLTFGYTVSDSSFFSGVKKVSPGHYIRFSQGKISQHKYWDASDYLQNTFADPEEKLVDQLEELLISSFKYRMVSDVPVGIFFSGGVDSSMLVAILSKHYGQLNTFTIGFDDSKFDETPYARKMAEYFKTNHTDRILHLSEAKKRLGEFYKIYDEPFFDSSGVPTSMVAELAKDNGMKVVLSSEGGDELFAGYPSYQRYFAVGKKFVNYPRALRAPIGGGLSGISGMLPKVLQNKVDKLGQLLQSKDWVDFYQTSIGGLTHQKANKYIKAYSNQIETYNGLMKKGRHPIESFMLWDIKHLLPNDFLVKVDRATMFHGVEGREPFLDHRLIEFALQLPLDLKIRNGETKYLLKQVLKRYVPSSYFDRPKMGFSIPLFSWFKSDIEKMFSEKLTTDKFSKAWPQLDPKWVELEKQIYSKGKQIDKPINLLMMWKLLGLMLWFDEYGSAQ